MSLSFNDIAHLFAQKGGEQYTGEPVTQLEHALQTALQAEQEGQLRGAAERALGQLARARSATLSQTPK